MNDRMNNKDFIQTKRLKKFLIGNIGPCIMDNGLETEDFEKIESVLAVYTSFVLDLKPIIPTRILDQMINVEIALRLHAKELEENNGPLSS